MGMGMRRKSLVWDTLQDRHLCDSTVRSAGCSKNQKNELGYTVDLGL